LTAGLSVAVVCSGVSGVGGWVKRYWADDVQPCIDKHCVRLLQRDQSMNYWTCINKFCASALLKNVRKRRLLQQQQTGYHSNAGTPLVTNTWWRHRVLITWPGVVISVVIQVVAAIRISFIHSW